jgi:hypothetical protein
MTLECYVVWRALFCLLILLPQWSFAEEFRLSYGVESFLWEEFDLDPSGNKLEESGFRHVFSLEANNAFTPTGLADLSAHVTFGTVAYDGWSGERDINNNLVNKVERDTNYRSYGLEVGFSYFPGQVPMGKAAGMGGRLALGMNNWDRTILGSGGYQENYHSTYGRAAAVYMVPSEWRVELGAKLPVNTSEHVDLSAFGYAEEVNLNPKGQPSLYVTWYYQFNERFGLNLNYDGYRFARSDDDIIYNTLDGKYRAVHQPRSEMHTLGLAVTLSF